MMYLRKIYTRPDKFFDTIIFRDGINFIYAYRDKNNKQGTINNLGKSTFLDLIDFCLGADFTAVKSQRLFAAYDEGILNGITVFLEIESNGKHLIISREFNNHKLITLAQTGFPAKTMKLDEAKEFLFNFIFTRQDYSGLADTSWLRSLLPFYIKILRHRKAEYPDPFFYMDFKNITELLQYHLFILNINNYLFHELLNLNQQKKKNTAFKNENHKRLMQVYNLKKFDQAQTILNQKNKELEELRVKLHTFRFAKTQQINSEKANDISKQINQLVLKNHIDKQKVVSYTQSLKETSSVILSDVEKIYNEAKEEFGTIVRHSLEEIVAFKKNLHESRKLYVEKEVEALNKLITERDVEIEKLDKSRADIYKILSTANSIVNYSDSRNVYDDKLREIVALEEHINAVNSYTKEVNNIIVAISNITKKILAFCKSLKPKEKQIYDLIETIHKEIYVEPALKHVFSLTTNIETDSILRMHIMDSAGKQGKGINKSRSLIYDLTVMFYTLENKFNSPHFIIHDGIFDGFDKAKALETFTFLDKKIAEGFKFQYIVTLNDEGIYKTAGKNADALHQRILNEAIVKLTPNKPLLKINFS